MSKEEWVSITEMPLDKLRKRAKTGSYLYERALDIALLKAHPKFSETMVFLQSWVQIRVHVLRRRKGAKKLLEVLNAWATAGQLLLSLRRFHFCCRRIQGWWRRKRQRMLDVRERVKAIWKDEELEIVSEELAKHDRAGSPTKQKAPDEGGKKPKLKKGLTIGERIALMTTDSHVIEKFLAHELRIRRYKILTKVLLWRVHMEEYYDQVENWRMSMEARVVMMERTKEDANPDPPPIMPGCPTHIPNEEEIRELVKKCRLNPNYRAPLPKPTSDNEQLLDEQRQFTKQFEKGSKEVAKTNSALLSARDFMPKIVELEKFGLVPNLAPLEDPLPWVLGGTKPKIKAHA
jgi:hypothetical protein